MYITHHLRLTSCKTRCISPHANCIFLKMAVVRGRNMQQQQNYVFSSSLGITLWT